MKCPKCGYARQPNDTAPDYECPKCGVVYSKVLEQSDPRIPDAWKAQATEHARREQTFRPEPTIVSEGDSGAVRIVDIDMRFWSMVRFMVKWAVATIPAAVILVIAVAIASGTIGAAVSAYTARQERIAYAKKVQKSIGAKEVFIGMKAEDVERSWGRPSAINTTVMAGMRQEQWIFEHPGDMGSQYVYLYDGLVTSIQSPQRP